MVFFQKIFKITGLNKALIILFKMFHHKPDDLITVILPSTFHNKRSGFILHFLWKFPKIHIDSHSDKYITDLCTVGSHLSQDPTDFLSGKYHIIGPLNAYLKSQLIHCLCNSKSHYQSQHRCILRFKFWTQENCHHNRAALRRFPFSVKTSPACRLELCYCQSSVLCPFL